MNNEWDFVERYYPNYTGCGEIALNNDLQKIVDREVDSGSHAEDIYKGIAMEIGKPCGTSDDCGAVYDEARRRLSESNEEVYRRAILGYLETLTKN